LSVRDVRASADFYVAKLGFWLAFTDGDPPGMAGLNLGQVQVVSGTGHAGAGGMLGVFSSSATPTSCTSFTGRTGSTSWRRQRTSPTACATIGFAIWTGNELRFGHRIGPLRRRAAARDRAGRYPGPPGETSRRPGAGPRPIQRLSLDSCLERNPAAYQRALGDGVASPTPGRSSTTSRSSRKNTASSTTATRAIGSSNAAGEGVIVTDAKQPARNTPDWLSSCG
jgi:hypothetical protein